MNRQSALLRADDLTPQFGYVGNQYAKTRVLLLGINPGNGTETVVRSATDARMMPALVRFAEDPTHANFESAQLAYKTDCITWHVWRNHCKQIIGAGKLSLEEVAYSNCLPWRTGSESGLSDSVGERAATLYAFPLIEELQPSLVIAVGKKAAGILRLCPGTIPHLITWNRAQAATQAVLSDRAKTAAEILAFLGR